MRQTQLPRSVTAWEKWEQSRREPCWEKVAFGLGLEERLGDPREGDVETLGWERRGAYLRQVPS